MNYLNAKCIWVRSRNCGCLVTWFCYQLIAKPGNKTATVSWPDPYVHYMKYHINIELIHWSLGDLMDFWYAFFKLFIVDDWRMSCGIPPNECHWTSLMIILAQVWLLASDNKPLPESLLTQIYVLWLTSIQSCWSAFAFLHQITWSIPRAEENCMQQEQNQM